MRSVIIHHVLCAFSMFTVKSSSIHIARAHFLRRRCIRDNGEGHLHKSAKEVRREWYENRKASSRGIGLTRDFLDDSWMKSTKREGMERLLLGIEKIGGERGEVRRGGREEMELHQALNEKGEIMGWTF